jgi:hypothetical protein
MRIIKNLGDVIFFLFLLFAKVIFKKYIKDEDELIKTIKTVTIPSYITQEIERCSI